MNGSPSGVLGRVEGELRTFWSTPPSAGEPPRARACTRNLIVVGGTPEVAERWAPVIDDLLRSVPARAIVVGLDPDGPDGLDANTTAVCVPGDGGADSCSERIQLIARGAVCARLASCVHALCGSDVPTTLVWLGRVHVDDPAFTPLAVDADRIVLDAAEGSLGGLAHVVRWAQTRSSSDYRPGVADLAWTRLAPWQELCARLFDRPNLREMAAQITRVRIVQSSAAGASLSAEGGLLLGWLATRLGWKATSLAGRLRLVRPGDGTIQAQLRAQPSVQAHRGVVLSVEIEAGLQADKGGPGMRGSIVRSPTEPDVATWRLEIVGRDDARRIEQRVRIGGDEPARLLARTLRRPAHDETLAASATWADELRDEELACG